MVIVEHNGPEYRLNSGGSTSVKIVVCAEFKCEICKHWSNTVDYIIEVNKDENKTVYICPNCNAESTYFHDPITIKENKDPLKGPLERPEPIDSPPDSRPNPALDKWIKELRENAIKRYGRVIPGVLYDDKNETVLYNPNNLSEFNHAVLNGYFTIEQLEALTNHMKRYNK